MKRQIQSALLALAILLSLCSPLGGPVQQVRAAETETDTPPSGTWYDLTWSMDEERTLYISGTGDMQEGEALIPNSLSNDDDHDPSIQKKNLVYPWSYYNYSAVVIGEGVTSIAPEAFCGDSYSDSDTRITFSVSLPASLESIGDYAFDRSGNVAIGIVTLPAGLTSLGYFVFGDTPIWGIRVAEDNTAFSAVDDVLFNYDRTQLILYPYTPITSDVTAYTVPDTVTSIREYAFYSCKTLTEITIPNGVTKIGEGAFYDCEALSITLPDSLTDIGESAFAYSGLTSLTLLGSLNKVSDYLCFRCDQLKSATICSGVKAIGDHVFSQCIALESITLPSGVTDIGNDTFYECTSLETVTLPNSVTAIGDFTFFRCIELNNIAIPNGVTAIGSHAFCECRALTALQLPNSVTSIGESAFELCTSLATVNIPTGIRSLSDGVFSNCTALTEIVIPKGVTKIGDSAFMTCTNLTEKVVLPSGVTEIGSRAFMNCIKLTGIEIPDGVTTIGGEAFAACRTLTTVQLPDSVTTFTTISDIGAYGSGVFYGCSMLQEINIPAGLKTIPDHTFEFCKALTKIVIPKGVTEIGESAFEYCYALRDLTVPKTVTTVGKDAFADCTALGYVYYGGTCARWDEITIEDGNKYLTSALISCTDGYYGVADRPGDQSNILKLQIKVWDMRGYNESYEGLLPLYPQSCRVDVQLSLEDSWFTDHSDLMEYDAFGNIGAFAGTVRVRGYSGGTYSVLYEKQGTEVNDNRVFEDGTASQLVFQMETSDYREPFEPDQLLLVEILDKGGSILASATCRAFPMQRWSFDNYDAIIDGDMIKDILGNSKGRAVINANKATPLGSEGLCFGMAATASLVNSGDLFPTMFQGCTVLEQVQKDTKVLTMLSAATAQELIQMLQVIQHTKVVQAERDRNTGDVDGLIQAIDDYKSGRSAMPVVWLKGTTGSKHAICAYDYHLRTEAGIEYAYLSCYDNSFPYRDCQLRISLAHRLWKLIGYEQSGYSGGGSTMTYLVPSGFDGTKGEALMSAKTIYTLETSGVKLVDIDWICNATDTEATDTTDTGLYWVTGSGAVSVADLTGETVSTADDHASYTVNSASAGAFALTDGEVDTMTATGDTVSLSCEYELADETGGSTLVRVTFDGASAGAGGVSLGYDPGTDTVTLTGAGAGTLTVVYDDEDDTTVDPSWTETVTGGEPTVSLAVTGGCRYDAATHTVTLNTVPQGTESVLIAAYADGQLLCAAPGALGRTALNAAVRRADELRIFYLDGDQRPVAERSRIQIPQS